MNRSEITLLKNETIVWGQSRKKNLLTNLRFIIPFTIVAINLIILALSVYVIMIGALWASIIFEFIAIAFSCYFFWIGMKDIKKKRRILKLSDEELKNYEFFDIITNQRYIRRNYAAVYVATEWGTSFIIR